MIRGSCLCGAVRFEIEKATGPFELCHCRRCRKSSGSAFAAGVYVKATDLRFVSGRELLATYEAPILRNPPPYRVSFCSRCGSPVPNPGADSSLCEIPAGLLEDDPALKPDKHIFVEHKASWFDITDDLPRYDLAGLLRLRSAGERGRD